MAGVKRDCLKFEKLVGIKDAERFGSAFPRGARERVKVVPAFYNEACCITGMTLLEPGQRWKRLAGRGRGALKGWGLYNETDVCLPESRRALPTDP